MTIDETIKREKEIHKDNQMVVETHIVHEDFTLEELYCDDTEVIEEHLESYRFASEYHKQIAEWLEELKSLKAENAELHNEVQAECAFLDERDAEVRVKAIDEFAEALRLECIEDTYNDVHLSQIFKIADQLKGGAV